MMYFNNIYFWILVSALYPLMNLRTPFNYTIWFGVLNFACLSLLFTFKLAIACLGFATIFWATLFFINYLNKNSSIPKYFFNIFSWLSIACIVGVFLLHKSNHDNHSILNIGHQLYERYSAIQPLFNLMTTITFSYIFLRLLDAVRAVMAGNPILDPVSLLGYMVPFFMLAAGPVNSYTEHVATNKKANPEPSFSSLLESVNLITWGLFLKFVCAEGLRILFFGVEGQLVTGDIFHSALIFIYVFFDFAGYSYVAYGIGKLINIPTPMNFQRPYLSKTVTEFWTRWHVSLGDFVKRTIFIPSQVTMVRQFGVKYAYWTNLIALLASFVFVAIWHRISVNFLIWGIAVGSIMAFEKIIRDWLHKKKYIINKLNFASSIIGPAYVFCVVIGTLHFAIQDLIGQ